MHLRYKDGLCSWCKDCQNSNSKVWRGKNKKRIRDNNVRWRLANKERIYRRYVKRVYGISEEDYEEMLRAQDGKCAICRNRVERMLVDHCHRSKRNRGLLCVLCNGIIGMARDKESILLSAINYLRKFSEARNEEALG